MIYEERAEKLIRIAALLTDAKRIGIFAASIIKSENESLAGYFARRAASAYLKADAMLTQFTGEHRNHIFYHSGGPIYDTPDALIELEGWYFLAEDEATYYGPYACEEIAEENAVEYSKTI